VLDGANFEIEEPPGQAWCLGCSQTVTIAQRGDACPVCGGYQLQPSGGMELRVLDMQVI
jgi:hydrogenase nickel incorporation protein HypA/HybF